MFWAQPLSGPPVVSRPRSSLNADVQLLTELVQEQSRAASGRHYATRALSEEVLPASGYAEAHSAPGLPLFLLRIESG